MGMQVNSKEFHGTSVMCSYILLNTCYNTYWIFFYHNGAGICACLPLSYEPLYNSCKGFVHSKLKSVYMWK